MKAADVIKTMNGSERLIIRNRFGEELFRGFKRLLEFHPETTWLNKEMIFNNALKEARLPGFLGKWKRNGNTETKSR